LIVAAAEIAKGRVKVADTPVPLRAQRASALDLLKRHASIRLDRLNRQKLATRSGGSY
jgi:hypothetical protein